MHQQLTEVDDGTWTHKSVQVVTRHMETLCERDVSPVLREAGQPSSPACLRCVEVAVRMECTCAGVPVERIAAALVRAA